MKHRELENWPPPIMTATPADPSDKTLPAGPRRIHKKAVAAGWWARITRAVGPRINSTGHVPPGDEAVATVAVACAHPDGRRLVAVYRWRPNTGKWEGDGAQDMRSGAMLGVKEMEERL